MENAIGKVTATESNPTSCGVVRFWIHQDVVIRPFDIVRVPHIRNSFSYAIVRDLEYITDSSGHLANYISSDFGDVEADAYNKRLGATVAEADILYNTKDIEMPLRDGTRVEWADEEGIRDALGLRSIRNAIPAGYLTNSNDLNVPVEFESDYLLGPEGAHLNIAGISGLATKTTYAMFLLSSIQQRLGENTRIIVFNVKGQDLLGLDEPATPALTAGQIAEWKKCGLEPQPFSNVTYLYPFSKRENKGYTQSHVDAARLQRQQEADCVFNYYYDVENTRDKLRILLSDIDDSTNTMESIFGVVDTLEDVSWDTFRHDVRERTRKGSSARDASISVQSWRKFCRLLETRTTNDIFTEKATIRAEEKRHVLVRERLASMEAGQILVVDIAPLPTYLQAFVFGDVIQTIYGIKLGDEEGMPSSEEFGRVIVFADELNKYAPQTSGEGRALTNSLLEITERGRSLGVVLFGAEQFRSGVHSRVLGNCSTNIFGRTSPVEVDKCSDYRYFPKTHKWAVQRLEKGQLLLQHPIFKTSLIKCRFPFPAYFQPRGD